MGIIKKYKVLKNVTKKVKNIQKLFIKIEKLIKLWLFYEDIT